RVEALGLPGEVGLAVGRLLGPGALGPAFGLAGELALLAGHLGSLGGGVVAAGEPGGQVAQGVGRPPLGLRPLLRRARPLPGPAEGLQRLLLLGLGVLAGAELLRFVGDLLPAALGLLGPGLGRLLLRQALGVGGGLGLAAGQALGAGGLRLLAAHLPGQ